MSSAARETATARKNISGNFWRGPSTATCPRCGSPSSISVLEISRPSSTGWTAPSTNGRLFDSRHGRTRIRSGSRGRQIQVAPGKDEAWTPGVLNLVLGHDPVRDPALRAEAANFLEVHV